MNLSEHFTLAEATASDTALRLAIDNQPDAEQLANMRMTAARMEQVRAFLGYPIHVNSWLRVPALNRAVGGYANSDHMKGLAVDFTCAEYGTPLDIVHALQASNIAFDQVIQEGAWVHLSVGGTERREVLTAHFGTNGTTYTKGA
jgi:hypothetical protein